MDKRRHRGLIGGLRAELMLFVRVALIVLAVPLVHPLAEAEAAENGEAGVICTAFGANDAGGDRLPGAPDECPCGVLCAVSALALPAGPALEAEAASRLETAAAAILRDRAPFRAARSIRPPGRAPPGLS